MEQAVIKKEIEVINDRKCFNCGKVFRKPVELQRHKNRKTPCLIREVAPENIRNPNRCIYCNRVFVQHCSMTRHLSICKIKNGGMEILADKVRYEQEIRLLREQLEEQKEEMNKQRNEFHGMIDEMKKQMVAPVVNNITNNTNNITNNITINNYLTPNYKFLLEGDTFRNIFKRKLVQTAMELIPLIWFNADHRENLSTYLVNKSTGETLAYDGSTWKVVPVDTVTKELRNRAYEITSELVTADMLNEFTRQIPAQIKMNRIDTDVAEIEEEKIYNSLIENRELVRAVMECK